MVSLIGQAGRVGQVSWQREMTDADYMDRALFWAERGRGRTTPNPLVGAVVVAADGVVVGQGFHEQAGTPHAEVRALDMAGSRAQGAVLYCNLEPCCHTGRTGPCVERIVDAGISRVVSATEDPNPVVRGQGFAYLRAHGVDVGVGVGAAQATRLNQPFFTFMRERRPFVVLKAAMSSDGYIASAPGQHTRLTSAAANRHAHRLRAEIDAIGVGVGTVLADDPLLTVRGVYRGLPLTRVIFDRHLRTPVGAKVLSTPSAGPVIIVTTAEAAENVDRRRALECSGARIEVARDPTFRSALESLAEQQVGSLLLEGGAAVHAAAWDEGLVDFVRLYVAPVALGEGGVPFLGGRPFTADALFDLRTEVLGPDVLIEGYVHGPH